MHCPQCYCQFEYGKNLDLEVAKHRVDEAIPLGLKSVNLSGGETLCYPHLYELIEYIAKKDLRPYIAISGALFDQVVYEKLVKAGTYEICVSLNGSTAEVNSISRDGYEYAIRALQILKENQFPRVTLNWVMHSTNADDFPNFLQLAEDYNVAVINVIGFKPDSSNSMKTVPTVEQIVAVSNEMKQYRGPVTLSVETCYSNFLAIHLNTKLLGNLNITPDKGCAAGRTCISVNVDGKLTPCRHIDVAEDYATIEDYWDKSEILATLRKIEVHKEEPCISCAFERYCRHCQAISWQIKHRFFLGYENCPTYIPLDD